MKKTYWPLLVFGLSAVVAGAVIAGRRERLSELAIHVSGQTYAYTASRDQLREAIRKRSAVQPAAAELEMLRADRAALGRLRNEIDSMRQRVALLGGKIENVPDTAPAKAPTLWEHLHSHAWRNVGQETPAAAIETALWAALNGDLDTLAQTLEVPSNCAALVRDAFEKLPNNLRGELHTPERIAAFLTATRIRSEAAEVLFEAPSPTGTFLVTQLTATGGDTRILQLELRTDGDRWRIVVPPAAFQEPAIPIR